jgi:hypothetical protein
LSVRISLFTLPMLSPEVKRWAIKYIEMQGNVVNCLALE